MYSLVYIIITFVFCQYYVIKILSKCQIKYLAQCKNFVARQEFEINEKIKTINLKKVLGILNQCRNIVCNHIHVHLLEKP